MFIRDVLLTLSTEFITLGGNVIIGILLARALSVADRGILALVMTMPVLLVSLTSFGLPQANIYLVGKKKFDPGMVWGNSVANVLIIGSISVFLLSKIKGWELSSVFSDLPNEYWFALIWLIPIILMDVMSLSILRALQRFDIFNLRRLLVPLISLGGFIVALFVLRGGLNAAVGAYIIITILFSIFGFLITQHIAPIILRWNWNVTSLSFKFGLKSYIQNLLGSLNYRLDIYLIAIFLDPSQVAFYAVAVSIAEIAWQIPNSIGVVLYPRLSNVQEDQIHQITAKVCRNSLGLVLLFVIGLASISSFVIPLLYGEAYRATIPPLLILMPGIVIMVIYKVLTRNYTSQDRQQLSILVASIALMLNIGLGLMLIPRWGIIGAAFASTVGYTTAGIFLLLIYLKETKLSWHEVLLPKRDEFLGHWHWLLEILSNPSKFLQK